MYTIFIDLEKAESKLGKTNDNTEIKEQCVRW